MLPETPPNTATEPHHLITDKVYLPSLEGWRGVVAVAVVLFHFYGLFSDTQFFDFGYLGVDFFFVLSGFIISRQYEIPIALRHTTFLQFSIKRIARLYPLYIFSIGLFMLVNAHVLTPLHKGDAIDYGFGPRTLWRVVVQLLMVSNIAGMAEPWNGPAWSVSVEWIVNLLYFGLVWHFRRVPKFLLWSGIIICTVYLVNDSPHTLHLAMAYTPIFNPTIARGIVGFSIGSLLFRYHKRLPDLPMVTLMPLEATLMFTLILLLNYHDYPFPVSTDYVLQLFIFPAIIAISIYRKSVVGWFFGLPPFRFLGKISYSVYLLQIPIGYFVYYSGNFKYLEKPYTGVMLLFILIGASTLTFLLIEEPFRYLGRKISKRFAKTAEA